jgi:hypothetical protein
MDSIWKGHIFATSLALPVRHNLAALAEAVSHRGRARGGIDIEMTGLDPIDDRLRLVQSAAEERV